MYKPIRDQLERTGKWATAAALLLLAAVAIQFGGGAIVLSLFPHALESHSALVVFVFHYLFLAIVLASLVCGVLACFGPSPPTGIFLVLIDLVVLSVAYSL